jgi:hypothetical protein
LRDRWLKTTRNNSGGKGIGARGKASNGRIWGFFWGFVQGGRGGGSGGGAWSRFGSCFDEIVPRKLAGKMLFLAHF